VQGGERLVLAFEKVADGAAPLPLISIQGWNRDKWPALIDTASAESWIAFPAALTMKLRPLAPPGFVIQPVHVADSANGYLCLADTLRLGDAIVNNSLFFARGARPGLGPLARGIGDPPPVMVLGMRFLEAFGIVQLDFPGRAARLSTFSSYAPDPARLRAALPYRIDDGVPVIEGRMDGERVDFCIDSAGTFAVAIVGGDEPGAAAVAVELGDWRVDGVEVTGVTIEEGGTLRPARLGAGLLARYVVTLVTADKRVIFEAAH
jgi:hypothetical protein